LLQRYTEAEHEEKRKKHFGRVKSSVKNLTEILEDFLSLEKLEQGKLDAKSEIFNCRELIESIRAELENMLKEGQYIKSSHQGNEEILIDRKMFRNILVNLLSNAVKYSLEHKEIHIATEVKEKTICISVKDSGIGIPEEDQKNLFSMFYRAKNAANIQGTGLGLNIVKRYVELLNGTVSFESKINEGTTFHLEFPKNIEIK